MVVFLCLYSKCSMFLASLIASWSRLELVFSSKCFFCCEVTVFIVWSVYKDLILKLNILSLESRMTIQVAKQLGKRRLMCCSICGKAFGKSSDLVRHYRIHTGDRPFSCNRCNQKFSLKSSLNIHMERHVRQENSDSYYTSARCPVCMKQVCFANQETYC